MRTWSVKPLPFLVISFTLTFTACLIFMKFPSHVGRLNSFVLNDDVNKHVDNADLKSEDRNIECRFPSSEDYTNITRHLFPLLPKLKQCPVKTLSLCSQPQSGGTSCVNHDCQAADGKCKTNTFQIGQFATSTGQIEWRIPNSLIIKTCGNNSHAPFVFIRCLLAGSNKKHMEMLIHSYHSNDPGMGRMGVPDINLLHLDSISRPHFYRSLPGTVKSLQKLAKSSRWRVLDFEKFHSLVPRTSENFRALFTGSRQKNFDLKPFLSYFKWKGFKTLYQEDICWSTPWGLAKELNIHNDSQPMHERFLAFQKAVDSSMIDDLGVTLSACEVLKQYSVDTPFFEPLQICLNGIYQHDYSLSYYTNQLSQSNRQPILSFNTINTAHDHTGIRVQTLDKSLIDHLKILENTSNTITVIFSDHGNTYTKFQQLVGGKLEEYNPALFIVIPSSYWEHLAAKQQLNAVTNQQSLITFEDLHWIVKSFTDPTFKKGLFANSPLRQTCNDLHLPNTSHCICQGSRVRIAPEAYHYLVAESAISLLNEKIYYANKNRNKLCEEVFGHTILDVVIEQSHKNITYHINIETQYKDVFSVTARPTDSDNLSTDGLVIININRETSYRKYEKCAPPGVELSICLCNTENTLNTNSHQGHMDIETLIEKRIFFKKDVESKHIHGNCLFVLTRSYETGIAVEGLNVCNEVEYSIELIFSLENMKLLLSPAEAPIKVDCKQAKFINAVFVIEKTIDWGFTYEVAFAWRKVEL